MDRSTLFVATPVKFRDVGIRRKIIGDTVTSALSRGYESAPLALLHGVSHGAMKNVCDGVLYDIPFAVDTTACLL